MTQFKAVKKKTKIKKNVEKEPRPLTPIDKKTQAEINLREMMREALRIHKDHIARSRNGSLKFAAKELPKKLKENHNRSDSNLDGRKKQKIKRSNRADKVGDVSEKTPGGKIRRSNQEREILREKSSEELAKSKKKLPAKAPAEIPSRRKEPASLDLPNAQAKKEDIDNQFTDSKIKYYQLGPTSQPFVSLNLLDKMKCHESEIYLRPKKGILRQKKGSSAQEGSVKAKAKACEEKNKKPDEKKSDDTQAKENKRGTKKAILRKSDNAKSGSVPKEAEKAKDRQGKSKPVVSSPKGDSLNLNTATANGDPYSSNASRSYFSLESDISKIDKKFMEIIEAVTQYNPKTDIGSKPQEVPNFEGVTSAPGQEDKECSEVQEQLLKRIKSLEEALQLKTPDSRESEKYADAAGESQVEPSEIQQLYVKGNPRQDEVPNIGNRKEENNSCFALKKAEKLDPEEVRECRQEEKKPEEREETKIQNPEESHDQTKEKPIVEAVTKKRPSTKEGRKQRAESPKQAPKDLEKLENKPMERWSIIKRLEKAFETLGLNLDELESSDEDGKLSEKKKPPRPKKQDSSGKERKVSAKSETLKKVEQASTSSKKKSVKRHSDDIQYGVESNGSGDKNMEYKPVRNSQKSEDLKRVVRKARDRNDKSVYYAVVRHDLPPESVFESKAMKARLPKKRYSLEEALEDGASPKKSRMAIKKIFSDGLDIDLNGRKHFKNCRRERNVRDDDIYQVRRSLKRKSDNSLSLSCSFTSLSDEDNFLGQKRKRRSFLKLPEPNGSEEEFWNVKTTGRGDTIPQVYPVTGNRAFDGEARKAMVVYAGEPSFNSASNRLRMEEENNELELKNIRERHKQIISEIKTSLEEIKKQHNLFTKLRVQTKKFNRDCHAKRKLITAYLKDVDRTYDGGREKRSSRSRFGRALSTESYYYQIHEDRRDNLSDYDLQMKKLRKRIREYLPRNHSLESVRNFVPARDVSSTEDVSSALLNRTSTEEEEYRSMRSSYRQARRRRKSRQTGMLYLGWKKTKEESPPRERVPSYLLQLMDKLNKVIVTEKNQLEDLVVKASGTSDSSSHSEKSRITDSGKQSRSWFNRLMKHRKKVEDSNRVNSEDHRTSSSESIGYSSHKRKKSKKDGGERSDFEDADEDIPQSKPRSLIQGDPGGRSVGNLLDAEREMLVSESLTNGLLTNDHKNDSDSLCIANCKHLERQAEEVRYRKGDPSFRTRGHWLKTFCEHSRHCRRKTPEEERAQKRKTELERILEFEDRKMKRPFARDLDGHTLDHESSHGWWKHFGHGKHRQKSIIIDHNREEENEESQTVLGHASRHSSVSRTRRAPHEYLRGEKRSDIFCYTARSKHELWKELGRKHHAEEIPVNFIEINFDNPCSSGTVSKDVDCQTDNVEDYEDFKDIYLWEDSESNHSYK